MKEKWTKEEIPKSCVGATGNFFPFANRTWGRPASKPLSTRAINNYNNISTSNDEFINYTFVGDNNFPSSHCNTLPNNYRFSNGLNPLAKGNCYNENGQTERAYSDVSSCKNEQLSAESVASAETLTSADSEKTHTGSTTKLIKSKNVMSRCWSWIPKVERGLSCISLAACFGNIVRLPLTVNIHGGAPFLLAYLLLLLVLGLPLIFLELGIGQIVQQGVTKTWRAVPIFKGVGYVKLIANCIVCIYYPLYIGLALYYMVWLAKGPPPFNECASVKITENGYRAEGKSGQECIKKTFLESPFNDPKWFGTYMAFICVIWLIIMLCSFRKMKAYMRSMNCFFLPIVGCIIALIVSSVNHETEFSSLERFYENIDWSILLKSEVWYYALIQLFFSTHLGFGNVVTCAGKVYSKADPYWAALGYFITNAILGVLSVIMSYILSGYFWPSDDSSGNLTELYLFTAIYDNAVLYQKHLYVWAIVAYLTIFLSGFISMLAIVFTILKAIRVESRSRWKWWQVTAILCFIFFFIGTASLLVEDFRIAHILDHYVVGNLLLLSTFLEVVAFVVFYGCTNIYVDFEFILGTTLSYAWRTLWCLAPIIMMIISAWAFATMNLTGLLYDDPIWIYCTGWGIVAFCIAIIVVIAVYKVYIQVDYNLIQKLSSATKASRKWGPVDPMLRHGWIQWRSTVGKGGDKDFTLKRRGTRDYTHSVKNRRNADLVGTRYVSTTNISDSTTMPRVSSSSYRSDHNENKLNGVYARTPPLQVISITDTLERQDKPRILQANKIISNTDKISNRNHMNPLGIPSMYGDAMTNESMSEGYGTIRNGPYIISSDGFDHVCWRRSSQEEATEL